MNTVHLDGQGLVGGQSIPSESCSAAASHPLSYADQSALLCSRHAINKIGCAASLDLKVETQ